MAQNSCQIEIICNYDELKKKSSYFYFDNWSIWLSNIKKKRGEKMGKEKEKKKMGHLW